MMGCLIAAAVGGAGAVLLCHYILQPLGHVLELCDDLVEKDGRFVTPGRVPQQPAFRPAARPDVSVREVARAPSLLLK